MVTSIGVSGSRILESTDQQHAFFHLVMEQVRAGASELYHGGCTGADAFMHLHMTRIPDLWIHVYPGNIKKWQAPLLRTPRTIFHDELPTAQRNQIIAERDVLIAAPLYPEDHELSARSGTWQTVRKGKAAGRLVLIANFDGTFDTYHDPNAD